MLLLSGLVRQHDALGKSWRRVVILRFAIVAAIQGHQAPRRTRRSQAFMDEAADSIYVDITVGRIVLDVR